MKIQESAENYLETILILSGKNNSVRSIDVATELNFSKPSVSVAMKNLRVNGFIEIDADGYIALTPSGNEIAIKMYERHKIVSEWLISIGVDTRTALDDACRIEHVISETTFNAIKNHAKEHGCI